MLRYLSAIVGFLLCVRAAYEKWGGEGNMKEKGLEGTSTVGYFKLLFGSDGSWNEVSDLQALDLGMNRPCVYQARFV